MLELVFVLLLCPLAISQYDVSQLCVHHEVQHPILLISRLDGVISAIELSEELPILWEHDLGHALLSTSSRLQLKDNSMLVPSLDGNLYSLHYNGSHQTIQPYSKLETLLSKKYEYGQQSRWVGGKVITTTGISPHDGKVLYKCNMDDCKRYNDSTVGSEPLLAITAERKTVRLLDMKLGVESWNWSISTVEMQYIGVKHRASCLPPTLGMNMSFDVQKGQITVQFENGRFASVSLGNTLSQAWVLNDELLQPVNMFYSNNDDPNALNIYVGEWENVLYIQPFIPHRSIFGIGRINELLFHVKHPAAEKQGRSTISWEYHVSTNTAVATTTTTGLIPLEMVGQVWTPQYNYLPQNVVWDVIQETREPVRTASIADIWYYLTRDNLIEKLFSTILVAGIIGFFLYRKILKRKPSVTSSGTSTDQEGVDSSLSASPGSPQSSSPNGFGFDVVPPFESRFELDFTIIRELGQGGFGKVLEAKHKISDHNYAIKVIKLPYRDDLKKKVEREVAAMAKLEHGNILRYYTSWKETPSLAWTRTRKYTNNSESFDSGTSTKSTSPSYLRSPKLASTSGSQTADGASYNLFIGDDTTTSGGIVFQHSDQSESIIFRKSPSFDGFNHSTLEDSDSMIVFEEPSSLFPQRDSKKPNLILPLHRKVVERTGDQSEPTSDQSQSVRIPVLPISKSVSFSGWGEDGESDPDQSRSKSRDSSSSVGRIRQSFLYIQMQLCSDQTLKEWLVNNTDRSGVMQIFSQIIDAVEYIHSKNHIHRDLKPSNILFTEDGRVKVADFGLATVMSNVVPGSITVPPEYEGPSMTQNLGTKLYMSPELDSNKYYDFKVDIFALGIVFFELLVVFNTYMERVELLQELRNKHSVPSSIDENYPKYKVILLQMIATNPNDRPTASEIKQLFSNEDCDQIDFGVNRRHSEH